MTKKIVVLAIVMMALAAGMGPTGAWAATDVPFHCGLQSDNVTFIPCEGPNPENVSRPWGTNSSVPRVAAGTISSDEFGLSYPCPVGTMQGCSDLTRTDYYREQMMSLARQIIGLGAAWEFPALKGWFALVK